MERSDTHQAFMRSWYLMSFDGYRTLNPSYGYPMASPHCCQKSPSRGFLLSGDSWDGWLELVAVLLNQVQVVVLPGVEAGLVKVGIGADQLAEDAVFAP